VLRSLASCSDHQKAVTVTGGARLAVAAMRDYPDTEEVIERSIALLDMLLSGEDTADIAFDDMQAVNGLLQVGPAMRAYRSHSGIQVSTARQSFMQYRWVGCLVRLVARWEGVSQGTTDGNTFGCAACRAGDPE
jgi:hypothetical protein